MEFTIRTTKRDEFIDIGYYVEEALEKSGIKNGIITVFVPHTTAGVTINEDADPDVVRDLLWTLDNLVPERREYKHMEGNSHAHMKASIMGSSCNIIVEDGKMKLGTWQGIYFCEFDGPRTRRVYIKVMGDK
ncbi:secondary thiamine-phosphate synthase enzyme YjbQ [Clostridium sp. MSJ-8]|uniref:secondary thiamine-phosphate synthase enzyme YjbQ n=1 Tax=Clostridium sp. MSJ-8 TaxID=2841510 RepID=UPI001C0E9B34|nr:secondary thiamine-phosphate synthase enzyme YjbQ [Clostridium sp. MSJ-8]MBU5488599.1 secondary thiamine-phosphate synthase enzyme YjbQ [Clostridium sp. MSJ-8]